MFNHRTKTRIKICGITREQDALAAAAAGVDAIGLVFHQPSPRALSIGQAQQVVNTLPQGVGIVGLFVDAPAQFVAEACKRLPLDLLQFHGAETSEFCKSFSLPWMKAVSVAEDTNMVDKSLSYLSAWALLLDTFTTGQAGGSGRSFDWGKVPAVMSDVGTLWERTDAKLLQALESVTLPRRYRDLQVVRDLACQRMLRALDDELLWDCMTDVVRKPGGWRLLWKAVKLRFMLQRVRPLPPVVLAGGLNADNVDEAMRRVRPWAVDVSSGVESEPGIKDAGKMRDFVARVRDTDRRLEEQAQLTTGGR